MPQLLFSVESTVDLLARAVLMCSFHTSFLFPYLIYVSIERNNCLMNF